MGGTASLDEFMATMIGRGPDVPLEYAERLAQERYGIEATAERLTGERDENFRLQLKNGPGYVLKIANPHETAEATGLPISALLHLERTDPAIPCPRIRRALDNSVQVRVRDPYGALRSAVVYSYLPGQPLLASRRSPEQRRACGRILASLGRALREFDAPAAHRTILWDLREVPRLAALVRDVPDVLDKSFLTGFIDQFGTHIRPRLVLLRHQYVHNDFNARNVLVDPVDDSRITGVIDFGDSVHTALVADVAVGSVGQLADAKTAVASLRDFVEAYSELQPLTHDERSILPWLIAGRIVQSAVITHWHRSQNPTVSHFDAFGPEFFSWRIALAKSLVQSLGDVFVN